MTNRILPLTALRRTKVSMHTLVGSLSVIISPVLCAIISFVSLIRRRKPSFIGFSLSLSLIYSFFPVLWDARNNFLLLTEYGGLSFSPYVMFISFLMESFDVQYMAVMFLFGVVIIYSLSRLIAKPLVERKDCDILHYYLCLSLFFMTIEFRAVFDIQKTTLALALFVVALNTENLIVRWAVIALAVVTHPFVAALAMLIPAARVVDVLGRRVLIILFLIAILITAASVDVISIAASFMSERVQFYAQIEESRFSSEAIAHLIWSLRLFGVLTVAVVSIKSLKETNGRRDRILLNILISACLVTVVVSRNEIFAERFFLAIVILTAYTAAVLRFTMKLLISVVCALGLNVVLHGGYTMLLVFSPRYDVMGSVNDRIEDATKLIYYPTLILLDYQNGPRSDNAVSRSVSE